MNFLRHNRFLLIKRKVWLGQSILEYTVVIGIVVTALTVMQVYMKRGIQAAVKVAADQLADQRTPDVEFGFIPPSGYLLNSQAQSQSITNRYIKLWRPPTGFRGTTKSVTYKQTTNTQGSAVYNKGEKEKDE